MKKFRRSYYLHLFIIGLLIQGCSQTRKAEHKQSASDFYAVEDFKSVAKIDAHTHLRSEDQTYIKLAAENNFRLHNINVYTTSGEPIEEQQKLALRFIKEFPGKNFYATTFSLKNFNEEGWQQQTIAWLKNSFSQGAVAVKIWKNVGMELKDNKGKHVMIDHPAFDPILNYIAKNKIPLVGHIGEPKNCWLPVEQMTVAGDKKYFSENPGYHMYLHPELPLYEDHINARDRMLEKHPDLIFIGAHLGSLEWSVDELGKRLDKFPNMAVDMAARVPHFKYQAKSDWKKVHDFFIKYQDRLLYATDIVADKRKTPEQVTVIANDLWLSDWKFFVTDGEMKSTQVEGAFTGLKLPRTVIDKIYRTNAEKWLPLILRP